MTHPASKGLKTTNKRIVWTHTAFSYIQFSKRQNVQNIQNTTCNKVVSIQASREKYVFLRNKKVL